MTVSCGSFSATMKIGTRAGRRARRRHDVGDDVARRGVLDVLRRVEAQAVEVELVDPVAPRSARRTRAPAAGPSKLIARPQSFVYLSVK